MATVKIVRSARSIELARIEKIVAEKAGKSVTAMRAFWILSSDAKNNNVKVADHMTAFDAKYPLKSKGKTSIVKADNLLAAIEAGDKDKIAAILAAMKVREAKVAANVAKAAKSRKDKKATEVVTTVAPVVAA